MSPFKSTRIAWSVAFASLALWATSAPVSWGQAAAGATHLFDQSTTDTTSNSNTTVINITQQSDTNDTTTTDDGVAQTAPCPPVPPAIAQLVPTPSAPPAAATGSADSGTFHLCGADPQAERDIEKLIAGRSFSSTLSARGDGCADFTVRATSPAGAGSATSNLSVSLGSGKTLTIKISSQGGATSVSIGSGQ
jgi:hypothetical protein